MLRDHELGDSGYEQEYVLWLDKTGFNVERLELVPKVSKRDNL